MGWGGWTKLGGTTDVALAPVAFGKKLYLFSKGIADKKTYWSSSADGQNWSVWKEFGGTTDVALAPVVFGNKLYLFSKGIADKKIYWSSSADGQNWSAWKEFGGTTDAALAPVAFGNKLYLFSKGIADKKIYWSSSADGQNWSAWKEFGGTTDVALAPVAFGNKLYLFSKGIADKKIYWSSSADGQNWTAWKEFGGTTDAAVAAVGYGRDLYLVSKGIADKRIYVTSGGDASAWSVWYEVPPRTLTTDASVATVTFANKIFLFAKGEDNHIYAQSIFLYPLPFDGGGWTVGKGNWDDPVVGHGPGQEYAFDFNHDVGANVRAARAGEVVFVENNDGNTTIDPSVPGYGTAILIRHSDNTAAAYDHLTFQSTKVVLHQKVEQGTLIALSGNTGESFGPHLHFDLRQYWNSPNDLGPTIPINFHDKNHAAWRPKVGDPLAP